MSDDLTMGERICRKILFMAQAIAPSISLDAIFLPSVLMIEVGYTEDNKEIFDQIIKLKSEMLVGPGANLIDMNKTICYELKGYTRYQGTGDEGHYQASVKRGNCWYLCNDNDTSISQTSEKYVPRSTSILIYEVRTGLSVIRGDSDKNLSMRTGESDKNLPTSKLSGKLSANDWRVFHYFQRYVRKNWKNKNNLNGIESCVSTQFLNFLADYGKMYKNQLTLPNSSARTMGPDEWLVRGLAEKLGENDMKLKCEGSTKRIQNCGFGVTQNTTEPLNIIATDGEYSDVFVCVIQLLMNSTLIRAMIRMYQFTNTKTENSGDGVQLLRSISNLITCHVTKQKKTKEEADMTSVLMDNFITEYKKTNHSIGYTEAGYISLELKKIMMVYNKTMGKWIFTPENVLEHVREECIKHVAGIKFIWSHIVSIEWVPGMTYKSYHLYGHHELYHDTTDLNNVIIEDIKSFLTGIHQNNRPILSIRLPPMLIFTKGEMSSKGLTITDVALFTDRIELQNEKFIGAHDEKSNEKCVYRLKGFLVRDGLKCVSYIRKNGGQSKTLLADTWYRCDVTGSIKMHEYIDEDEMVLVPELDVEMQNVSNDGEKEVICFYEAERRIDEEIKVIHPSGGI